MTNVELIAEALQRLGQPDAGTARISVDALAVAAGVPYADLHETRQACGLVNGRGGIARIRGWFVEVGKPIRSPSHLRVTVTPLHAADDLFTPSVMAP